MPRLGAVDVIDVHARSVRAPAFVRRDPSALAERLIGELFGWELSRLPRAEVIAPSIHAELLARYRRGDRAAGRYPALAPSPEVDRCLGRLVRIARGEFESLRSAQRAGEVRALILSRIHADPELRRRARALRKIAGISESEMEHHWSDRLRAQLRGAPARLARKPAGPERLQRLTAYLCRFPYIANYAHLVRAELELLAHVQAASRETAFAVIGCGSLPITGLMLHAYTGARVTLVDLDGRCVERAAALSAELVRLGVLDCDAVSAVQADGAQPETWRAAEMDVVLVASLVPQTPKLLLARGLPAARSGKRSVLLLRSAAGLCAELAYEAVPTQAIAADRFAFLGASRPAHSLGDEPPLAVAHPSVLNTTELYCARPVRGVEQPCPIDDRNDCCS